ncbi:hypothetical protein GGF50DRAFT_119552 [Schizophyllum commune]
MSNGPSRRTTRGQHLATNKALIEAGLPPITLSPPASPVTRQLSKAAKKSKKRKADEVSDHSDVDNTGKAARSSKGKNKVARPAAPHTKKVAAAPKAKAKGRQTTKVNVTNGTSVQPDPIHAPHDTHMTGDATTPTKAMKTHAIPPTKPDQNPSHPIKSPNDPFLVAPHPLGPRSRAYAPGDPVTEPNEWPALPPRPRQVSLVPSRNIVPRPRVGPLSRLPPKEIIVYQTPSSPSELYSKAVGSPSHAPGPSRYARVEPLQLPPPPARSAQAALTKTPPRKLYTPLEPESPFADRADPHTPLHRPRRPLALQPDLLFDDEPDVSPLPSPSPGGSYAARHKKQWEQKSKAQRQHAPSSPHLVKGKGRVIVVSEDKEEPLVADSGLSPEYIEVDKEEDAPPPPPPHPSTSREPAQKAERKSSWTRGRMSEDLIAQGNALMNTYIDGLVDISKKGGKPLSFTFRKCGFRVPDAGKTRDQHIWNAYQQWHSATNAEGEARAAYRKKMKTLGKGPTDEAIYELFEPEITYVKNLHAEIKISERIKEREKALNDVAEDISRMSTGLSINNGFAIVAYVVDVEGTMGGKFASSKIAGGGPAMEPMIQGYEGNWGKSMSEVTTVLRSYNLHALGICPIPGQKMYPYYPRRDWRPASDKNPVDIYNQVMCECLRYDITKAYDRSGLRLSSTSTTGLIGQIPREVSKIANICFILGIHAVNWPDTLLECCPGRTKQSKPGKGGTATLLSMLKKREEWEDEVNAGTQPPTDEALFKYGAVGFVSLSAEQFTGPLTADMASTPIARGAYLDPSAQGAKALSRLTKYGVYATWESSPLFKTDLAQGSDSRRKWQDFWGDEQVDINE